MGIYNHRPYIGGIPLVGGYNLAPYLVNTGSSGGGGGPDAELVTNVSLTGQDISLASSPISLTGLESETYDYYGTLRMNAATLALDVKLRLNGASSTFDRIYMLANGTNPSGSTTTLSDPSISSYGAESILINFRLTGTIAGSRIFSYQAGYGTTTQSGMYNGKMAWSDTVNEITSLDFFGSETILTDYDYIVYRVPKVGNQGNWEFVDSLEWAAEASTKSFTGLSLDTDKEYRVSVGVESGVVNAATFNNSTLGEYDYAHMRVQGSALAAFASTGITSIQPRMDFEMNIRGDSGGARSMLHNEYDGANSRLQEYSSVYTNTVDDVESIQLNKNPQGTATATANLYKAKAGLTGDAMPFELVEERTLVGVDLNGSPEVFSSLAGNSVDIFKIDMNLILDPVQDSTITFGDFNGDTTAANYAFNVLDQIGSSTSATDSATSLNNVGWINSERPTDIAIYIYPKVGNERPFLIRQGGGAFGTGAQKIIHGFWTDTVNELASFKISSGDTHAKTGTIRLSKLIAI